MDLQFTRQSAFQSLSRATYNPQRLATIHIGVTALVSLILSLLGYFLSQGVGSVPGLSGIGTRTFLVTIQYLLSAGSTLLLPFWEIGFLFATLAIAREQTAAPSSLLEGFRRFLPVLRLFFLEVVIFIGLAFAAMQISCLVFTASIQETVNAYAASLPANQPLEMTADLAQALLPKMIPVYGLFAILYAVVGIPLFYRIRLATFAIMDDAPGARAALACSAQITRGSRWSLFLVDLHFWWYYAALLLISLLAYAADLLNLMGIQILGNLMVLICYVVYLVLQVLFFRKFGSYINTTYAHCYLALRANTPSQDAPCGDPIPKD